MRRFDIGLYHTCGVPGHERSGRHISSDHAPRCDNTVISDGYTGQND